MARFVSKVRALDPSYRDVVPWQPRAYSRKRGRERGSGGEDEPQVKKLFSPLLEAEKVRRVGIYRYTHTPELGPSTLPTSAVCWSTVLSINSKCVLTADYIVE